MKSYIKPNLFVIGAMKSGTTSLHNYLNTHRSIYMSEPKEPGYFVDEINWHKGEDWYLSLFENAGPAIYKGESSTDYTKYPIYQGVAERIYLFNPEAKLIYVMRNPFDRIISHYWHAVRHISTGGLKMDITTACKKKPEFIAFSDYPMQIRQYLKLFKPSQIYLTTFEELVDNPSKEMQKIYRWLGLDDNITQNIYSDRWNARPKKISTVRGTGFLNSIRYSWLWDRLSRNVPKSIRTQLSKLAVKEVSDGTQSAEIELLRTTIKESLEAQIYDLSTLTGKDYSNIWYI